MKCMNCDNVLTGRQRQFCSDRCRKAQSRTKDADKSDTVRVQSKSDRPPEVIDGKYNPAYLPGGEFYVSTGTKGVCKYCGLKLSRAILECCYVCALKPKPANSVQAIWNGRNAQGQPTVYAEPHVEAEGLSDQPQSATTTTGEYNNG